jgi:ABC-type glycerol-3-phosphate transport system substrate-binding protein
MSRRSSLTLTAAVACTGLVLASVVGTANAAPAAKATKAFPTVPARTQVSIKLASYMPLLGTEATNTLNSMLQGFETLHPNIHVSVEAEASSPTSSKTPSTTSSSSRVSSAPSTSTRPSGRSVLPPSSAGPIATRRQ